MGEEQNARHYARDNDPGLFIFLACPISICSCATPFVSMSDGAALAQSPPRNDSAELSPALPSQQHALQRSQHHLR